MNRNAGHIEPIWRKVGQQVIHEDGEERAEVIRNIEDAQ
jgi:hypothetical protein